MTNMPGMFALRAWESRERPRERHRWHLINTPAPLFEQKQVPGAGPRGGSYPHPRAGYQQVQWCQPSTRAPAVPWGAHLPSGSPPAAPRAAPCPSPASSSREEAAEPSGGSGRCDVGCAAPRGPSPSCVPQGCASIMPRSSPSLLGSSAGSQQNPSQRSILLGRA